jgi:hypothetical protein
MTNELLPEQIATKIYFLRGQRVMLDADLAEVYGVRTIALNQAVKRNINRFPPDFMFQVTAEEYDEMQRLSQTVITSLKYRATTHRPYAFTEHGAVMLASVLRSPVAIAASIQVVRAFVRLRTILAEHKELAQHIEALEKKVDDKFEKQDEQINTLFSIIRQLMAPPTSSKTPIGFKTQNK